MSEAERYGVAIQMVELEYHAVLNGTFSISDR